MRRITTAAALCLAASLYPDIDGEKKSHAGEFSRDAIQVQRDPEWLHFLNLNLEEGH